ncbi:hypothetical protein EGK75_10085 [Neisseria weixii]|uniref:Uncharacterized protein n=1 Tax=Neisseria weixii TaxID=1853276 RepID=A0A3N4MM97_9NEIS|nr:hypothetical protein [Neisseria weixii]RPD84882.1 hypothetical protein EGK74_10210 [Neisseria weixii]RPD85720.1 hypothetical protein EGK75_10085 [Neisseria weixii]
MSNKFFTGFKFNPKRAAIGCLVMTAPFLVLLCKEIPYYKYYFYNQPSYGNLKIISGIIADDIREPPKPYNKRIDGIYIDTGDKKINIYCDNPDKPLISYGTRGGGTYGLGHCEWIALQRSSSLCDKKRDNKLCKNPRYFIGQKILAKIDKQNTIYELYIDNKIFYKYEDMVLNYKNKFISNIRGYFAILIVFVFMSIVCVFLNFKRKKITS